MTDRTEAMDRLIAQDADLIDPAAEWQAGYDAGVEAAANALEESNRAGAPAFVKAFINMQRRKDTDQ